MDPQKIADAYEAYYTAPVNETRKFVSYIDNATRGFLENVAAGKKYPHTGAGDTETNAVAHVLPVVVARAGRPGFYEDAEAAIRVVQDNDDAVAFGMTFAHMLEHVILGGSVRDAIDTTQQYLDSHWTTNPNFRWFAHGLSKMQEWQPRPPFEVTLELGQACDFPFHVFTAPHFLLHNATSLSEPNSGITYVDAIRETIKIGGENADRGSFIGSLLAAAAATPSDPAAAIPVEWRKNTTQYESLHTVAEALADGKLLNAGTHTCAIVVRIKTNHINRIQWFCCLLLCEGVQIGPHFSFPVVFEFGTIVDVFVHYCNRS